MRRFGSKCALTGLSKTTLLTAILLLLLAQADLLAQQSGKT